MAAENAGALSVSVVICAYTERRWRELSAAVASALGQTHPPAEVIVVTDHNGPLGERAVAAFPDARVVPSLGAPGLSGARNTGWQQASGEIVAFLDDDAVAEPTWLAELLAGYADPAVLGVGGRIEPGWQGGRPGWFPGEFLWVVGCTYTGTPRHPAPVRNVIGASMSCRRAVAARAGGFREALGRAGRFPLGGEETEFCIRTAALLPGGSWRYRPGSVVRHLVPADRATLRYFLTRCLAEGLSKSAVSRLVGPGAALASERAYTLRVLPRGVLRGLGDAARGDPGGLGRAAAIVAGFGTVLAGYVIGRARGAWPSPPPSGVTA